MHVYFFVWTEVTIHWFGFSGAENQDQLHQDPLSGEAVVHSHPGQRHSEGLQRRPEVRHAAETLFFVPPLTIRASKSFTGLIDQKDHGLRISSSAAVFWCRLVVRSFLLRLFLCLLCHQK